MNIVGHGIDIVECARIEVVRARHPERFLQRVLTEAERVWLSRMKNPVPSLAGRWAAKEAILKALGTGWRGKIAWTDMEILPDSLGAPKLTLSGETRRIAEDKGTGEWLLSISHTDAYAAASVIALGS